MAGFRDYSGGDILFVFGFMIGILPAVMILAVALIYGMGWHSLWALTLPIVLAIFGWITGRILEW